MLFLLIIKILIPITVGYGIRWLQESLLKRRDSLLLESRKKEDRTKLLASVSTDELLDVLSRREIQ